MAPSRARVGRSFATVPGLTCDAAASSRTPIGTDACSNIRMMRADAGPLSRTVLPGCLVAVDFAAPWVLISNGGESLTSRNHPVASANPIPVCTQASRNAGLAKLVIRTVGMPTTSRRRAPRVAASIADPRPKVLTSAANSTTTPAGVVMTIAASSRPPGTPGADGSGTTRALHDGGNSSRSMVSTPRINSCLARRDSSNCLFLITGNNINQETPLVKTRQARWWAECTGP